MVERGSEDDRFEVIGSIAEAVDGADTTRLAQLLAAPTTAIVTLTVTEAVYEQIDTHSPISRLLHGLDARRAAGAGPIAVVSCDNLAANGRVARATVLRIAERVSPALVAWISENVSFVSTSVDRITPRTSMQDRTLVAARCGYRDDSPVVAEPFASWILCGEFPAGRPSWENAGAEFVEDIEPFENRKLWFLNGAHSLMAYAGQLREHTTVADAFADPVCRDAVESFWNEAARHLPHPELNVPEYRQALAERFANQRIAHSLAQIAADGTTKLRMRSIPVLRAELAAGRTGLATARVLAAWMDFVSSGVQIQDPLAGALREVETPGGHTGTADLLRLVDAPLANDTLTVQRIFELRGTLTGP